jgi:2'-5' RNA ligase
VTPPAVRAFIALEVPAELKTQLAEVGRRVADRSPGLRTTAPDSMHLTLRFLGSTREELIPPIAAGLQPLAAACDPADVPVTGLGTFPPRGRVRVLWVGLDLPPRFAELQRACEQLARRHHFEKEERDFAPHLTLGRWREPAPRPPLPPVPPLRCRLDQLVLFRSDLHPKGARYTPLARHALGGVA